jgi:DNA topoisomerase-1
MIQIAHKKISHKKIRTILQDPVKTAKAINLTYVNDSQPGIMRMKKSGRFFYVFEKRRIKKKDLLDRILKLVIPPAWENVWICRSENGHLQVTGLDIKRRKQYKYHPAWNALRNHTKFYRLYDFGKAIPRIRKRIEKDLRLKGLPLNKVLAAVVCLMERTSIRVGNSLYEKLYGSFGLTTLKDRHVKIRGSNILFMFKGKKGIDHNISLTSARLARIVKNCRDIPGKELFQYIDDHGQYRCIDSGMVNEYLKTISGEDFSAKDFRTWTGSVQALLAFHEIGLPQNSGGLKKNIVAALDNVAKHLGNTRTVCKKYYVHPTILSLYENGGLGQYLQDLNSLQKHDRPGLLLEEKVLMKILEKESMRISA